jgi:hypothetical protein
MTTTSKQTHYEILGVAKDATTDDIKKAFRKLARENHPDTLTHLSETAPQRVAAEETMRRLTQAYDVLSDATKRRSYDISLSSGGFPPGFNPFSPDAGVPFWYDFTSSSEKYQNSEASRQRLRDAAEHLRQTLKADLVDSRLRKTFLYRLIFTTLLIARPTNSLLFGVIVATFVTHLVSGMGVGEFLFATASHPEVFSIAPILTAFGFAMIGVVIRFVCVFYKAVVVEMYKALPVPAVYRLAYQAKRSSARMFIASGLFLGFTVGRLFF